MMVGCLLVCLVGWMVCRLVGSLLVGCGWLVVWSVSRFVGLSVGWLLGS